MMTADILFLCLTGHPVSRVHARWPFERRSCVTADPIFLIYLVMLVSPVKVRVAIGLSHVTRTRLGLFHSVDRARGRASRVRRH